MDIIVTSDQYQYHFIILYKISALELSYGMVSFGQKHCINVHHHHDSLYHLHLQNLSYSRCWDRAAAEKDSRSCKSCTALLI